MSDEEKAGEDVVGDLNSEMNRPVPLMRRKQPAEAQILGELDKAIEETKVSDEDSDPQPRSCSRQSVMALGKLQKTKNMLDMFEKKFSVKPQSNPIPRKPQPQIRKNLAKLSVDQKAEYPDAIENKDESEEHQTTQKFFAKTKDSLLIRSTPQPQVRQNRVNIEKSHENDGEENSLKNENENYATEGIRHPDFLDPTDFSRCMKFLEELDKEKCGLLIKDLVNSDFIGAIITEEMITREDFVDRVKLAAIERKVDVSDLSFAFIS